MIKTVNNNVKWRNQNRAVQYLGVSRTKYSVTQNINVDLQIKSKNFK